MNMKDLLLRFRPGASRGGGSAVAVPPIGAMEQSAGGAAVGHDQVDATFLAQETNHLQGFAEGRTVFQMPDFAMGSNPWSETRIVLAPRADERADHSADGEAHDALANGPLQGTAGAAGELHPALLRRFGVEHLSSDDPLTVRHALILQRLCVVRDTCEVVIAGRDRSVRIIMANGRVMAAAFELPGRKGRLISFRKAQTRRVPAREFAVLLAELCASAVDLVITECPASGVFEAAAGMVVGDLVVTAGLGPPGLGPSGLGPTGLGPTVPDQAITAKAEPPVAGRGEG